MFVFKLTYYHSLSNASSSIDARIYMLYRIYYNLVAISLDCLHLQQRKTPLSLTSCHFITMVNMQFPKVNKGMEPLTIRHYCKSNI